MSTINIKLYDILRKEFNLSDEKAKDLTETITQVVKEEVLVETTEYKSMFKEDFKGLDAKIAGLGSKIEKEILRMEVKIEQTKSDLIRWYVSLFVILALMIVGLYVKK